MINISPFRNAGLSFIKTVVMTTGEFEYDSIFGHNNENRNLLTSFPVVAYILWIIFLIIMPILLTNLLVSKEATANNSQSSFSHLLIILLIISRLCCNIVVVCAI